MYSKYHHFEYFSFVFKITHQNQYQNRTYIRQSYKPKLDNTFKSIFLTKMKRVTTNRWEGERHVHKKPYFPAKIHSNKTKRNKTILKIRITHNKIHNKNPKYLTIFQLTTTTKHLHHSTKTVQGIQHTNHAHSCYSISYSNTLALSLSLSLPLPL